MHPRKTSCTDGLSLPVPGTGRRSSKDTAKARAAEHASTALHRRIHAALTLPCKIHGEDSARALARAASKVAGSSLQRPPTSAAKTTNRARPPSPASSGYVRSFRRLATSSAAPSLSAALLLALPGWCRWLPGLHATRKARQPRLRVCGHRQRPGPQRIPVGNPSFPRPLPRHTLDDGGQTCQVGGLIGRCAWKGEGQMHTPAQEKTERLSVSE